MSEILINIGKNKRKVTYLVFSCSVPFGLAKSVLSTAWFQLVWFRCVVVTSAPPLISCPTRNGQADSISRSEIVSVDVIIWRVNALGRILSVEGHGPRGVTYAIIS